MPRTLAPRLLALALAAAGLAACRSNDTRGSHVVLLPKEAPEKEKACPESKDQPPEKHRHVWEEYTWHTYEDWSSGVPTTKISTVYRCKDCGEIRDESVKRRR